jgi:hypothetical protein
MRVLTLILGACLALVSAQATLAQGRTYGGFDCTVDCSGHSAGYKWAEKHDIQDESDCPLANNSPSFQEGCVAYTEDNARPDPNADDEGDMIGGRPEKSDDGDDDK